MVRLVLIALVTFGVWNGGRLSHQHYLSGEACPILGVVPACYIAFGGYLLMAAAIAITIFADRRPPSGLFWTGLSIAAGLALLGSVLELVLGKICPKAFGWLPMCYVSLAFSVAIGWLYLSFAKAV